MQSGINCQEGSGQDGAVIADKARALFTLFLLYAEELECIEKQGLDKFYEYLNKEVF
jgi:hypothetical protein